MTDDLLLSRLHYELIHTRFGAEAEPLAFEVRDGYAEPREDVVVHFAIPPSRAWDNVHQHCSLVLPFRGTAAIPAWCDRHEVAMGESVPLDQLAQLARFWYGSHARRGWRKWTVAEAQAIFEDAGLTAEFWRLPVRDRMF